LTPTEQKVGKPKVRKGIKFKSCKRVVQDRRTTKSKKIL